MCSSDLMDIKVPGITEEIMKKALTQAKDGRLHILGEMSKAMTAPRAEIGEFAPKIETINIPTDKIREVIGSGGKVIREIVEKTGAKVDINDDGVIKVAASDGAKIKAAIDWIKSIVSEPVPPLTVIPSAPPMMVSLPEPALKTWLTSKPEAAAADSVDGRVTVSSPLRLAYWVPAS